MLTVKVCDFRAMRVTGMMMVFFAILPLAVSICCWILYTWAKRDSKKDKTNPQVETLCSPCAQPLAGQEVRTPKFGRTPKFYVAF